MADPVRYESALNFARSTPIDKLPTLLRRVASDIDSLPAHTILGVAVELGYGEDDATVAVFLRLDEDAEGERS